MVRLCTFAFSGVTSWKASLFVIKCHTSHMMSMKPKVKNATCRSSLNACCSLTTAKLKNYWVEHCKSGFSVNPTFQWHFLKTCSTLETAPLLLVCCQWYIRTDAMALTGNETQKEERLVLTWRGWMTMAEEDRGPTGELKYRWRWLKWDKYTQESSRVGEER